MQACFSSSQVPLTLALPALIFPAAGGHVLTQQYALLPADLREVADLEAALKEAGFRPDLMTLVIAECVLVYMPPKDSQRLVSRLGELLPTAAFVVYEQVLFPHRQKASYWQIAVSVTCAAINCRQKHSCCYVQIDRVGWRCQR